jgi:hypothetical protein
LPELRNGVPSYSCQVGCVGESSGESSSFAYSDGDQKQTGGVSYRTTYASWHSSYSGQGRFVDDSWGEGAVSGAQSESGRDDDYQSRTVLGVFIAGKTFKVGFGARNSSGEGHYSYDGDGAYTYEVPRGYDGSSDYDGVPDGATIQGTARESGSDNSSYQYKTSYRLLGDTWSAYGSGESTSSGGWSTSFSGAGCYDPLSGQLASGRQTFQGATGYASAVGALTFHRVAGRSEAWHIERRRGIFTRQGICTS